jgi:hypothetical protein
MLEVLYKIPSRIIAARLTKALPEVISDQQHGFRQSKGIQEPILLATHVIQEANKNGKPLQLLSHDLEKAFDKTGHRVIEQSLRALGVPETIVHAVKRLALVGFAMVEVNGRKGILFTIRTGSGQGDPLSSILFLFATEPMNRAFAQLHRDIMYKTIGNIVVGTLFYADENLTPVNLRSAQDLLNFQNTYTVYGRVSGLNVNVRKSILCINTSPELFQEIQETGILTPETVRY